MKKLLLLLVLLLCCFFCVGWLQIVPINEPISTSGGGTCSDTPDQTQEDTTNPYTIYENARGQSFQVSTDGQLCAIGILFSHVGDTCNLELRIGTSYDLTSDYLASKTFTVTTSDEGTWVKITLDTPIDVSAGTTYYFGLREPANTQNSSMYYNSNGGYPNGQLRYATSSGWNMSSGNAYDLAFRIYLME